RDEEVASPSACLETISDGGVVRHAPVDDGDEERRQSVSRKAFELRIEFRNRELVAIRRLRREPAFARVPHIDVMEEQRDGSHADSCGQSVSTGLTRSDAAGPTRRTGGRRSKSSRPP